MYTDTCRACCDNYCGGRRSITFYLRYEAAFLVLCNSLSRPFFFCSSVAFTSSNACLIVILFNAPFITEDISQLLPRFLQSCADRRRAYMQHLSYFIARISVIIEQIHGYFQLVGKFGKLAEKLFCFIAYIAVGNIVVERLVFSARRLEHILADI